MLTEVKPKNSRFCLSSNEIKIAGYNLFTCKLLNKKCRGVACYVISDLNASIHELQCSYDDAIWLKLKIEKSSESLLLGCVYRSPSNTLNKNQLFLSMFNEIAELRTNNIIVVGDFNFPGIDWCSLTYTGYDNSRIKKIFIEKVRDCYFTQIIDKSTCFRQTSDNILDLLLVKDKDKIENLQYLSPLGKSDHLVIQFNYHIIIEKIDCMKTKYLFHRANYAAMKKEF